MLPVRCFTCNKVIGRFQDEYDRFLESDSKNYQEFFELHGIRRYCCRKIFLTHVDIHQHCSEFEHELIECRRVSEVPIIYKCI